MATSEFRHRSRSRSPPAMMLQDSQEDDWFKLTPEEAGQLSAAVAEAAVNTRGIDREKRWDKVDEIRRRINERIAKDELAAVATSQ